jgi:cobalt-zinc-cadmium efflux system outer membrane protein
MEKSRPKRSTWRYRSTPAVLFVFFAMTATAKAQGPQFNIDQPPGASEGNSSLGPALGQSGMLEEGSPISPRPFSGRAGPQGGHAPVAGITTTSTPMRRQQTAQLFNRTSVQPSAPVPSYGEGLDIPVSRLEVGPPNGLTIDQAIELCVKENVDLLAQRLEIPMAEADILTANLRGNPIFYADEQLVPYGHYSFRRPGGPAQADVNMNFPLDITLKRRARTLVAQRAKRVAEAQMIDAVRNQIDTLYTYYVDNVSARVTLRFSQAYVKGLSALLELNKELKETGFITPPDVLAIKAQLEQAELAIKEAEGVLQGSQQNLALVLSMPLTEASTIQVRDFIRDVRPLPISKEDLLERAYQSRPDMLAMKLAVERSHADVQLGKANGYPDVYLLWQPYTFQNNSYLGVQSPTSWTVGVTATVPIFNRNQGNVRRAKINVYQTELQKESVKRHVQDDVLDAVREFELSLQNITRTEEVVLPAAREVRDAAFRRWQQRAISALDYLDAQRAFNDTVKSFRDALIRHRRAMLDLNTAIGERVLP